LGERLWDRLSGLKTGDQWKSGLPSSPTHVDVLDPGVAEQFVETLFPAEAAVFPATVRGPEIASDGIDPDAAKDFFSRAD
jgi:hypothetical protein